MIPQTRPEIGPEEVAAVARVVASGWLTEGPVSEEFVARLCALVGSRYGVLAPNGTLAIALALYAIGVGRGDEVIVPDSTMIATATAVLMTGATPVLVDVDSDTLQIDVAHVLAAITERTAAVLPVHFLGSVAPVLALRAALDISGYEHVKIVEDAAQAIGVAGAGSMGQAGCFSFFADKTITTGEGGFVACQDEDTHRELLYARNQGRLDRGSFIHDRVGWNFRLTDTAAAIGLCQLDKLDRIVERKRQIVRLYDELLVGLPLQVYGAHDPGAVPFRAAIMCDRHVALALAEHLAPVVQARTFFYPLHLQPALAGRARFSGAFLGSTSARGRIVLLPCYPGLTDSEVEVVCACARAFWEPGR